jgi:hypothetical protein
LSADPDNIIDSLIHEAERVGMVRARYRREAMDRGDNPSEIVRKCYKLDRAFDQAVYARKFGPEAVQRKALERLREIQ